MMQRRMETQQLWDWRAAAYLFLAGTGAGSTLVAIVYALLFDSYSAVTAVGLLIGPLLAILGSLFLSWTSVVRFSPTWPPAGRGTPGFRGGSSS